MASQQPQMGSQDGVIQLVSRIRSLEGQYNLIKDRSLMINQNMIESYKKIMREVGVLDDELREVKNDIFRLKETIRHLVKETDLYAKKEDVTVLAKYINLWNPMKFVTEKDVEKMLEEVSSNSRRTVKSRR